MYAFDPNGSISLDEMNAGRQRAILVTIDYDGQDWRGDSKLYRGRAIAIHAPRGFAYADRQTKVVQIDREISGDVIRHGRMPIEALKDREFTFMERELLKNSRELVASPYGPELTLVPTGEYQSMQRQVEEYMGKYLTQKEENLHLAARNMKVRNDALRWKALATKLRLQRDAALGSRIKRLVRRWLRS